MTVVVTHTTPADASFSSTGAAAWNADHALSGVGTMAEQNANNVAITGGTVDGAIVGGTTPAAGTFTTLTATGTGSFGTGSTDYVNLAGFLTRPFLYVAGSSTNISMLYRTKGSGAHSFNTADSGSNEQLRVSHTASAVNYVQVTGAATGSAPVIAAQGSDSNIVMRVASKGTQVIAFSTNYAGSGTGNTQLTVSHTASSVNNLNITGSAAGNALAISATGSDPNIAVVVQPKGTGALQAQQTDSTATGGNARGANAVDWQTSRSSASAVASAQYGTIVGGTSNTASGFGGSVLGGAFNTSSNTYSVANAGNANTASGGYSAILGGNSNTSAGYYNFVGGGFTNSGTASAAVTTQSATMNGTTAVTLAASNASIKVGQYITGTSIAADTYVAAISGTSLTLSKVASGSSTSTLSFYTPHGVVVGGGNNQATGSYSFIGGGGDAGTAANRNVASGDWSTVAGGAKNTASGLYSFVGGGTPNTASGAYSGITSGSSNTATGAGGFIGAGVSNVVNGTYSAIMGGYQGTTRGIGGYHAFPATINPLGFTVGACQSGLLVIARETTDATATRLTSDATTTGGTTNQVILPNNSAYYFKGTVIANVTGGGNTKGWTIEGAIKRGANAASTALVGTPTVMSGYADVGAATWTITATADTTNGGLAITFTGQAGTTIRCVAKLETVEVTF